MSDETPSPARDADPDAHISLVVGLRQPLDSIEASIQPAALDAAIEFLRRQGFELNATGSRTLVLSGKASSFQAAFGGEIRQRFIANAWNCSSRSEQIIRREADWSRHGELKELVEFITIERPHLYLAGRDSCSALPSARPRDWSTLGPAFSAVDARPPNLAGSNILDVLRDVPRLLNADKVHADGFRGRGVRVVMIDTGFAHGHPFFVRNGFRSKVCVAPLLDPLADLPDVDRKGHGTGESANLFAVAPEVELTGIKLSPDAGGDDSPLLGPFLEAVRNRPHIISISLAYDLCDERSRVPETVLRGDLVPLANEIARAVEKGIVVVAGSGNGQYAFPAQLPHVIAAGGVYAEDPRLVDPRSALPVKLRASNFASAFDSAIFDGRSLPDCCGLVGERPEGHYIVLPLPPGSEEDRAFAVGQGSMAFGDQTKPNDGWAVFSGTSAAAPQLAGVCALMLNANPALTPADVKRILCASAREVDEGFASTLCIAPPGPPLKGKQATGAGLVDAAAAVKMALGEVKPGAHAGP